MKTIKLTHGYTTKVCDCHYDLVKDYKWYVDYDGYARRTINLGNNKYQNIRMHRVINKTPTRMQTDHINRDKLDNRCSNLRNSTISQNQMNKVIDKRNTSGVKGVSLDKKTKKWRAWIGVHRRLIYLGQFSSKDDAVLVRQKAELEYHGVFACR